MSLVSYSRYVRVQGYGSSNMCKFMVVFRMQNVNTSGYAPRVIKLGGWRNDCAHIHQARPAAMFHVDPVSYTVECDSGGVRGLYHWAMWVVYLKTRQGIRC